jgi:hypothetical protein
VLILSLNPTIIHPWHFFYEQQRKLVFYSRQKHEDTIKALKPKPTKIVDSKSMDKPPKKGHFEFMAHFNRMEINKPPENKP